MILFFRSTLGVCQGADSLVSSDIRVREEIPATTPVASRFFRFHAGPGPIVLRFVEYVFPRRIATEVGLGVRQRFPFVVEPLGVAGHVSPVAPVR